MPAIESAVSSKLHGAIEQRNVEEALSLYADDAELEVIDHNHPPSSPLVMRGKEAIGDYLRDIFGREMTHRVQQEVIGDQRFAFTDSCLYPDGTRVHAMATVDLRGDKIVHETEVQAWDEK